MNKSTSTLSIRLQLPGEEETDKPARQEEVVYLWDRIIIVSVIAALVMIAVIVGAWQWLRQPEPSAPAIPVLVSQAAEHQNENQETSIESQEASISTNESPPAAAHPTLSATPEPKVEPLPSAIPAGRSANNEALNRGLEAKAIEQQPTPAAIAASATRPAPRVAPEAKAETASQPPDALAKVEILSQHLVRAQLSNDVVDREPVDHAQAIIPMNEQGLVKVYFFTEMQDLRGQTVFFDWFLEDKRMARVRARPHLDSANAYSSKFIDRHMVGQWQVKMQTEQGDTLAQAEFEVR